MKNSFQCGKFERLLPTSTSEKEGKLYIGESIVAGGEEEEIMLCDKG
jgi:hypothetical protein